MIITTLVDGTPTAHRNFPIARSEDGRFTWFHGGELYFTYKGSKIYCPHPPSGLDPEILAAGRAFVGEVLDEKERRHAEHQRQSLDRAIAETHSVVRGHDHNCPANLGGACECDFGTG